MPGEEGGQALPAGDEHALIDFACCQSAGGAVQGAENLVRVVGNEYQVGPRCQGFARHPADASAIDGPHVEIVGDYQAGMSDLAAQQAADDGSGMGGGVVGVHRRQGDVAHHHRRLRAGGAERQPVGFQVRRFQGQAGPGEMSVRPHAAQAGKMLEGGPDAGVRQPGNVALGDGGYGDRIICDGTAGDAGQAVTGEGRGGAQIHHRAEVEIDAEGSEFGALRLTVGPGPVGQLLRRAGFHQARQRRHGREPWGEVGDFTSFLIGSDDDGYQAQFPAAGLQAGDGVGYGRRGRAPQVAPGEVEATDQPTLHQRFHLGEVPKADNEVGAHCPGIRPGRQDGAPYRSELDFPVDGAGGHCQQGGPKQAPEGGAAGEAGGAPGHAGEEENRRFPWAQPIHQRMLEVPGQGQKGGHRPPGQQRS